MNFTHKIPATNLQLTQQDIIALFVMRKQKKDAESPFLHDRVPGASVS
jgi:hypothetical protein